MKKGKPLNNNLLDYKLPTSMDTPDLHVAFANTVDSSGPYGNKSLGEPPAIPGAPAIRNAVLYATGVAIDTLPLNPQKLVEKFSTSRINFKKGAIRSMYDIEKLYQLRMYPTQSPR